MSLFWASAYDDAGALGRRCVERYLVESLTLRKHDVSLEIMPNSVANDIVVAEHYLHRKRVGRLLSYGVSWRNECIGVLMFARPMVSHPMFGYKPTEIVELARVWFRINPKNLGSCAIRKAIALLPKDWPGTKAVISWCDTSRFDGALYKATGFRLMGLSRTRSTEPSAATYGGGRPDRKTTADRMTRKQQWLIAIEAPATKTTPKEGVR